MSKNTKPTKPIPYFPDRTHTSAQKQQGQANYQKALQTYENDVNKLEIAQVKILKKEQKFLPDL